MNIRYVTADVFTTQAFHGNPVAVVLDADNLSSSQMQRIAAEFNYSETTFVLKPKNPKNSAWVRIFSPAKEFPFAGHPNIGTAFILAMEIYRRGTPPPKVMTFEEEAGLVHIRIQYKAGVPIGAELIAPEQLSILKSVDINKVAACLSLRPEQIELATHAPQVASVGLPFIITELKTQEALRQCVPNLDQYRATVPIDGATSIFAYYKDPKKSICDSYLHIEARTFTNRMTEDSGTGSAAAATTSLLAVLSFKDMISVQVTQGLSVGRKSIIQVQYTNKDKQEVKVYGECVIIMSGEISIRDFA